MDVFTPDKRSWVMRRVRTKNTRPELVVRSALHSLGFRFRLHRKDLPGQPDIVLPRHWAVIFVHGCFWHGHAGCRASARPTTNVEFWDEKLDGNIERDRLRVIALQEAGWRVLVMWECEADETGLLVDKLQQFLAKGG